MDLSLYLKQLEELVNIDSGSRNATGITKVAEKLAQWYEKLGWKVQRIHLSDETGPLLLITNKDCDRYDAMFIGHMDTVFPDGTAKERPFKIEGDYYYGPGVGDMKNGDVAMYHIAANLPKEVNEKLSIAMVYNPDEEIGSCYSRDKVDEIGSRADHIFVMESAGNKGARHCFARKGSIGYEIEFHGIAAHAGFMFEVENASAILEMANYIVKLMALASEEEDTTVNVGTCSGGIAGNVVPDFAKLSVNMRFKKDSERIRVKKAVEDLINGEPFVKGAKAVIVSQHEGAPMVKTKEVEAFVARMKEIAERLSIPFEEKDRGGLSDGNHLSRCGGGVVLDGMGPHGANDHSEKENGYIPSVELCVRLIVEVLGDLAEDRKETIC